METEDCSAQEKLVRAHVNRAVTDAHPPVQVKGEGHPLVRPRVDARRIWLQAIVARHMARAIITALINKQRITRDITSFPSSIGGCGAAIEKLVRGIGIII